MDRPRTFGVRAIGLIAAVAAGVGFGGAAPSLESREDRRRSAGAAFEPPSQPRAPYPSRSTYARGGPPRRPSGALRPRDYGQTLEQSRVHVMAAKAKRARKQARWAVFCDVRDGARP